MKAAAQENEKAKEKLKESRMAGFLAHAKQLENAVQKKTESHNDRHYLDPVQERGVSC